MVKLRTVARLRTEPRAGERSPWDPAFPGDGVMASWQSYSKCERHWAPCGQDRWAEWTWEVLAGLQERQPQEVSQGLLGRWDILEGGRLQGLLREVPLGGYGWKERVRGDARSLRLWFHRVVPFSPG